MDNRQQASTIKGVTPAVKIRYLSIFAFLLVFKVTLGVCLANIPEPGIILYGKVFDNGSLLTSGELTWTFAPASGGDSVVITTTLMRIDAEGGPYSYRVELPLTSVAPGSPDSSGTLVITDSPVEYYRTAQVTGTSISMTDTVTLSFENRGTYEYINIGSSSPGDTDSDGMADSWEQAIVDADPDDDILSVSDVFWGDDFDGDGENNWTEWQNGTDPTDASSTSDVSMAYNNFLFEIFRGAEQPDSGPFVASRWGAKLICWPREDESFISGYLKIPGDETPVPLKVNETGDEARFMDMDYSSVDDLAATYAPGEYRVNLMAHEGLSGPHHLRFKVELPFYSSESFPDYITIESPWPQQTGVSTTPLFDFGSDSWDYVELLKADTLMETYLHLKDDMDTDVHEVPPEAALENGVWYLLGVDNYDRSASWLGSLTILPFRTVGIACTGDIDHDGDVDGEDLAVLMNAYNTSSSEPGFDPHADFNNDDQVDESDVQMLMDFFGSTQCMLQ